MPLEANGDRDLVDRLSKLPLDKQPFWFINWQALEELRKKPQTYPQRPSSFVDNVPLNSNSDLSNRFSTPNPALINTNTANFDRLAPTTISNQAFFNGQNANANSNLELGNRNGFAPTTGPPNVYVNSNVDIGNRNSFDQTTVSGNANANSNLGNRNSFEQTTDTPSRGTNANSKVDLNNKNGFIQTTPPTISQNVANTDSYPGYYSQGSHEHRFSHSHSYFYHTSSSHYQENKFHF